VRLYLLNKLFTLRPAEIALLGEKKPSAVRGLIIRVSDQLRCGEISLFAVDQEEANAAKTRLEAQRKQRRKTYTFKKSTDRKS
jgi:hypothetical protein